MLAALLVAACSDGTRGRHSGADVGTLLPDALLPGLDRGDQTLSALRGRPLLINVWASWCGPCRAEMKSLESLSILAADRLQVIGVSTDDDLNLALEFVRRARLSFPNFHDRDQNLERRVFGAAAIPLTLIVDADGRVVHRIVGARRWDSAESIGIIESSLRQRIH